MYNRFVEWHFMFCGVGDAFRTWMYLCIPDLSAPVTQSHVCDCGMLEVIYEYTMYVFNCSGCSWEENVDKYKCLSDGLFTSVMTHVEQPRASLCTWPFLNMHLAISQHALNMLSTYFQHASILLTNMRMFCWNCLEHWIRELLAVQKFSVCFVGVPESIG